MTSQQDWKIKTLKRLSPLMIFLLILFVNHGFFKPSLGFLTMTLITTEIFVTKAKSKPYYTGNQSQYYLS